MNQVLLKIPFPAHLMNYIYEELDMGEEFAKINARSDIGVFLMGIVEESKKPMPDPKPKEYVEFCIPIRDVWGKSYDGRDKWLIISEANISRLHHMVETIMMRDLFGRLDFLKEYNLAERRWGLMTQEIERFIAKYSNDRTVLSIDKIRKQYYRHCKKRESRIRPAM